MIAQALDPIDRMSVARQTELELPDSPKFVDRPQPARHLVPTGAVLVHYPSLMNAGEGGLEHVCEERRVDVPTFVVAGWVSTCAGEVLRHAAPRPLAMSPFISSRPPSSSGGA